MLGRLKAIVLAVTNLRQVSWYLLWTLSGVVGGVGRVGAASDKSGDAGIHVLSKLRPCCPELYFLISIVTCCGGRQ